jgi:hypothetical protein
VTGEEGEGRLHHLKPLEVKLDAPPLSRALTFLREINIIYELAYGVKTFSTLKQ